MKLLQINTTVNSGSTGRIAEDIGRVMMANGHESYIAYGRGNRPSKSHLIKIGNTFDNYTHGLKSTIFDRHGFGSTNATKNLIDEITRISPDVIGLHNLHGYYLNIEILFNYLKSSGIPVLWTLFDCWSFTGHCSYFDDIECEKWMTGCYSCPKTDKYPASYVFDQSSRNYRDKKHYFNLIENLELVTHSKWLNGFVSQSFLATKKTHHIFSGIDLDIFRIKRHISEKKYPLIRENKKIILGVASPWSVRKGLADFKLLNEILNHKIYQIVLIGLNPTQIKNLPKEILGINRTENISELADWYNLADVFVNPTYQDNFPTTNIEALACGTPVISYNTGGSPEAIDKNTGLVVDKGDIKGLAEAINSIIIKGKDYYKPLCRERAVKLFNKDDRYNDYTNLYQSMIKS